MGWFGENKSKVDEAVAQLYSELEKDQLTPLQDDLKYRIQNDEKRQLVAIKIHNDNGTPMIFVINILMSYFGLELEKATQIMLKVHRSGSTKLLKIEKQTANELISLIDSESRKRGYPLNCTVEYVY